MKTIRPPIPSLTDLQDFANSGPHPSPKRMDAAEFRDVNASSGGLTDEVQRDKGAEEGKQEGAPVKHCGIKLKKTPY
ncbi:hypothetical protein cyc_02255 [Cyclospora cayetanensis]|uniref:Uncharacterized protein n=1 Tax=Cyclospora cayetanensis TaxID=88456 RepID=A0A1D3D190_9EIME|nr:hypothetical protein cyc_02255 [Cyclospora cayetanensis]